MLVSSEGSFGPGILQTSPNAASENWKTGFLPHESKNRNSFDFFPNKISSKETNQRLLAQSVKELLRKQFTILVGFSQGQIRLVTIALHSLQYWIFKFYQKYWMKCWILIFHPNKTLQTVFIIQFRSRYNSIIISIHPISFKKTLAYLEGPGQQGLSLVRFNWSTDELINGLVDWLIDWLID